MKRTHVSTVIGFVLAGGVIAFLLELGAAAAGMVVPLPPVSLPITLILVAVIVIGFAVPIRRATRGLSTARIDPFRAMRVAVLAKACSLSGSLLTGAGIGVIVYLFSRAVLPSGSSVALSIVATLGAAVLLAAGLVAEYLCTLPPDDDDKGPEREHA